MHAKSSAVELKSVAARATRRANELTNRPCMANRARIAVVSVIGAALTLHAMTAISTLAAEIDDVAT